MRQWKLSRPISITAFPEHTRLAVNATIKQRLGRVQPKLRINVNNIWVVGWPWNTNVFVEWDGTATLLNGDSYNNRGLHVFTLKWGKVYALEEFQDSEAAANALSAQAAAGLKEAIAEQIIS
jgi:ketosteroid isomerase-like protein